MTHVSDISVRNGADGDLPSELIARHEALDPLRRLTSTPYTARLPMMGRSVRLETNSPALLDHMVQLFARYPHAANEDVTFLWRIVAEADGQGTLPWPRRSAFSDEGLRYAQFGQRSFLAVDLEAREAVAFVPESLVESDLGLTSPFLDNLFCLTVASLGLVSVWANCLAQQERGVLVFGERNHGKTSACYLAQKLGLDFYADEGVFLEADSGVLRGWGGFWPPTFRPEALAFLPDLKQQARPCFHNDFTVYHLPSQRQTSHRSSIQPVGCLFLERGSTAPLGISRIDHGDLEKLLAGSVLFRDDDRFLPQQNAALRALARLPAYVLRFDSDPAVAAVAARDLLASPDSTDPGHALVVAQTWRADPGSGM